MTTKRDRDNYVIFACDECGEEYETLTDDFKDGLADAKSDGWVARQTRLGWEHFCADCK